MSFFSKINKGLHSAWHTVAGDSPAPSYFTGAYHGGRPAHAPAPEHHGSVVVPPSTASEMFNGYADEAPAAPAPSQPIGVGRPPEHYGFTPEELKAFLE